MSRSRRSSVQRYHDRVAGTYDHSYEDAYWQWHDQLTWESMKPFLPVERGTRVLDLGCGTGKWGLRLLNAGLEVTFVDLSPQMLDQARNQVGETSASARAQFVRADLCDLGELPDQTYAFAVAMGEPIGCTDDPVRALREIVRVLVKGGLLLATFDNRLAAIEFYLEGGRIDELRRFLRDGRTHWLTRDRSERFSIHTYSPNDLRRLLESCGFEMVEMIGKTILPMRRYRGLLSDGAARRSWAQIERTLCRSPDAIGRAAHLQVVCRSSG